MTIKDIYHGRSVPVEKRFPDDSEYILLSKEWLHLEKNFTRSLTEQQVAVFNKLTDIQGEQAGISNERCYTDGFRHGASLVLDILEGGEDK